MLVVTIIIICDNPESQTVYCDLLFGGKGTTKDQMFNVGRNDTPPTPQYII